MDGQRFDDWARRLATATSRRGILRSLLGGAAAGTLSLVGGRSAEAANCRAAGRACREHANCCSHRCGPKDSSGRRRCECVAPTVACHGKCVDPTTAFKTDPVNCGSCGNVCRRADACTPRACADGACNATSVCAGGSASCCGTGHAACKDLDHDPNNCGSCGHACDNGQVCWEGQGCCTPKTCEADYPGQCGSLSQGCGLPDLECGCPGDAECVDNVCCTCRDGDVCYQEGQPRNGDLCQHCSSTGGWSFTLCSDNDPNDCLAVLACDPATGECGRRQLDDGSPCAAGTAHPCTSATCKDGVCVHDPINNGGECPTSSECTVGTCEEGVCKTEPASQGTPCSPLAFPPHDEFCETVHGACDAAGNCVAEVVPDHEDELCGEPNINGCTQPLCQSGSCVEVPARNGALCGIAQPSDPCQRNACRSGECTLENAGSFLDPCEGSLACFDYACFPHPSSDFLQCTVVNDNCDIPDGCRTASCNEATGVCDYTANSTSGERECDEDRLCCPTQVCRADNPCNVFNSLHHCYDPADAPVCTCCGFVCC